ncbi:hypothetical protein [Escherichia coli]|uniref:hypothetical protein n=1 Tax=Escherichia coli TaxID=562 RepID=UPI0039A5B8D2
MGKFSFMHLVGMGGRSRMDDDPEDKRDGENAEDDEDRRESRKARSRADDDDNDDDGQADDDDDRRESRKARSRADDDDNDDDETQKTTMTKKRPVPVNVIAAQPSSPRRMQRKIQPLPQSWPSTPA